MFKSMLTFIKRRWAYLLSLVFLWIIPLALLTETVVLAKTSTGVKLTFLGSIAVGVVLFTVRNKIKNHVNNKGNTAIKTVYSCTSRVLFYTIALFALKGLLACGSGLYKWWLYSGVSFGVGTVFHCINVQKEGKNGEEI